MLLHDSKPLRGDFCGIMGNMSSRSPIRALTILLAISLALATVYTLIDRDWEFILRQPISSDSTSPSEISSSTSYFDSATASPVIDPESATASPFPDSDSATASPALDNGAATKTAGFNSIHPSTPATEVDICGDRDSVANMTLWNAALEKHNDKLEDKFTVAVQTYKRPDYLNLTLNALLNTVVPSLHEVVVVWNDLETAPPKDFVSQYNVTVRYRRSKRNSLNEKLWADPEYKTKAILLHDDDHYYEPSDMEYVFNTWRERSQDRLTGFYARCVVPSRDLTTWRYDFCESRKNYALVLTGLAFAHISLLEYYSSEDPLMQKVRDYVDEDFNCEDIGLNFMTSMLTCKGPLQVLGYKGAANMPVEKGKGHKGLSTGPSYHARRTACVATFAKWFDYMPLHNVTEYYARGAASS